MALKRFRPTTPTRRQYTVSDFSDITKDTPEKSLIAPLKKTGARNSTGRATSINVGGGHKRKYRLIDFKRNKDGIAGKVVAIEYDPNRSARIALIQYVDGEKRYIIAPANLAVGATITSGQGSEIAPGNAIALETLPLGQEVHNVELRPGGGAKMVRSAGTSAQLVAKEDGYALLRMPSGEMRKVHLTCRAVVGVVSNHDHSNIQIGKAGRNRWLGIRPHNRGTSKNPVDHPMGGGQGKTAGGRQPTSRTAVLAKGLKTRNNKRTDKYIVRGRKQTNSGK